jgi:hypothetical protein
MDDRPTITDLLARPERVSDLSPDQAHVLVVQLSALLVALTTAMLVPTEDASLNGGRMLTPSEAAALANTTTSWIWRRARRADARPWVARLGRRTMRIREREFQVWLATGGGAR